MNDALIVVQQKKRTFQGEPQDLQVKSILSVKKEDQVHDLPAESTDGSGLTTNEPSTDPEIEEALRTAGLLSDSPPNNPHQEAKGLNDEDDLSKDNEKDLIIYLKWILTWNWIYMVILSTIWKSNFDKEIEDIEECPTCYSVNNTVNHSLPHFVLKA